MSTTETQLEASRTAFADLGRIVIGDVVDEPAIGKTWAAWHEFVISRAQERFEKFELLVGQFFDAEEMAKRIAELEAENGMLESQGKHTAELLSQTLSRVADKQNVIDPLAIQVERDEVRIAELEALVQQLTDELDDGLET